MDAGEIGFAHLAVLARTANVVGDSFDEADLLGLAKESSPGKLHYNCLHYRHAINAEAYAEDQAGQAHTRTVHMSTGSDGCLFITGLLDPVGGAVVRNALEPLARPSGADDHRLLTTRTLAFWLRICQPGRQGLIFLLANIRPMGYPGQAGRRTMSFLSDTHLTHIDVPTSMSLRGRNAVGTDALAAIPALAWRRAR